MSVKPASSLFPELIEMVYTVIILIQEVMTMILSVSRRTDIPRYYSEWFYNRIKKGFCFVKNPMNPRQISRIDLSPDAVDCLVFWSRDPGPMLERLDELSSYSYYFQFTMTGYGKDVEPGAPPANEALTTFKKLSMRTGPHRVIWRYDPIMFTERYTPEYHLHAFSRLAAGLSGYTKRCVISFVDEYAKNKKALKAISSYLPGQSQLMEFAKKISSAAEKSGITVNSCAEAIDLSSCGIEHGSCIDRHLTETIIGHPLDLKKDTRQRAYCGCMESIDIGTYDTCPCGCVYCYTSGTAGKVAAKLRIYDASSPLLCGELGPEDKIRDRRQ